MDSTDPIRTCEGGAAGADKDEILALLVAFNRSITGPSGYEPFAVTLRGEDGGLLGGAYGSTFYGWTFVEAIAVDPQARGEGIGRRLMAKVETLARDRGCTGLWLDTYSFQAPDFYRKLGFVECGAIDGFPPGHRRVFLMKRL